MNDDLYEYDVAISFLSSDELIAKALHDRLATGLRVFFYPRSQEDLAGTDGLESMRSPFFNKSRVVVVLYRQQWGKTPWTRVEETAIKEGCLDRGWSQLFFVMLEEHETLPVWLPSTHIRFSLASYGIDQASGAIKARVQECGGEIAPITALSRARLLQAETDRLAKKDELFESESWIRGKLRQAIDELFDSIISLANQIATEYSIPIRSGKTSKICSLTDRRVGLRIIWIQQYSNVAGYFQILEYHNGISLPNDRLVYVAGGDPPIMQTVEVIPELTAGYDLCWISKERPSEQLSTKKLADAIIQMFLRLAEDANSGAIDTTPELQKQLRAISKPRNDA